MAVDTTFIQSGHGTTFTVAGFSGQITSITPGAQTREVVPTTFLGSSDAHTKIPGDLYQAESWTLDLQYVPGVNEVSLSATAATCQIVFPTYGGDFTVGAKLGGKGFFSSFNPGEVTTDQLMTATATWEWSDVITYTSAAT